MSSDDARRISKPCWRGSGPLAVAVSGGVDSLTLADPRPPAGLGPTALMVHAVSPAVPGEATARVRAEAAREGWDLRVIEAGEFADPAYRANPVNRCFFCKTNLYGAIRQRHRPARWLSGANLDDLGEYRPGLDAAREHGVRHPYVEAGLRQGGGAGARPRPRPRRGGGAAGGALPVEPGRDRHPRSSPRPWPSSTRSSGWWAAPSRPAAGRERAVRCRVRAAGHRGGARPRQPRRPRRGAPRRPGSRHPARSRRRACPRRRPVRALPHRQRLPDGSGARHERGGRIHPRLRPARADRPRGGDLLRRQDRPSRSTRSWRPPRARGASLLLTRLDPEKQRPARPPSRRGSTTARSRARRCSARRRPIAGPARIAVVAAGTSDVPVAREAQRTLAYQGRAATLFADVGVAGLWRLTTPPGGDPRASGGDRRRRHGCGAAERRRRPRRRRGDRGADLRRLRRRRGRPHGPRRDAGELRPRHHGRQHRQRLRGRLRRPAPAPRRRAPRRRRSDDDAADTRYRPHPTPRTETSDGTPQLPSGRRRSARASPPASERRHAVRP